ncbi:hypothetical protein BpHYR1_024758 [Brachionus plicatilis]|uniref:Uncharacterized protein n=1 Tax=Brachionus plicatilis TaxID=10195 RepID=A0A3M7PIY7_BRAPC|nr:hypothetical protein BpHYR1_024758 [Brachionus plicatilis]
MSLIEEIPNNISQDQRKTRGKGKTYFPFCSFLSLENAKECLDREFEGNNWTIKRATETLQADLICVTFF